MSPRKHKFIGVPTSLFLHNTTLIKQELLLFDEIVFTDPGYLDDNLTPELELLIDKGLISAADLVPNLEKSKSYQETYELLGDAIRQCCDEWRKGQLERLARGYTSFNVWSLPCTHLMDEYATRLKVLEFAESEYIDAVPVFLRKPFSSPVVDPKREEVLRIALGFLPTLEKTTPIEQVLEFRSDPDSQRKFAALRHFMNEIARSSLMGNEIRDQIEWLICDYRAHMQVHKLKYGKGRLEVFIVTTAKTIENVMRLKISEAIEGLFSVRRQKADLLEAELKRPGKEVAYLVEAQERFVND